MVHVQSLHRFAVIALDSAAAYSAGQDATTDALQTQHAPCPPWPPEAHDCTHHSSKHDQGSNRISCSTCCKPKCSAAAFGAAAVTADRQRVPPAPLMMPTPCRAPRAVALCAAEQVPLAVGANIVALSRMPHGWHRYHAKREPHPMKSRLAYSS